MSRIKKRFEQLKAEGAKAFIPYIMAGDPSLDATKELVKTLEASGADIIELGVPFTDPLADGPTIQRAAERAIINKVTLKDVLSLVSEVRKTSGIPLILMTYYNPIYKFGLERFIDEAKSVGVDGLIIPDLPPDEADEIQKSARANDIDVIFMLAPTSTPDRIKTVAKSSAGFVYYVSLTGITGSKLTVSDELKQSISVVKQLTSTPVAVGFGVSTPDEAKTVSAIADGVIVGSAIVKLICEFGPESEELKDYLKSIRKAIG